MAWVRKIPEVMRGVARVLLLAGVFAARASAADAQADAPLPPCPAQPAAPRPPTNNVRLVTGAPYSALGTSETVTVLPDGNRIVRQNRVRLWRDSDGRTRSEYSLSSIGGPLPLEVNSTVTVIDDPAARTRYLLQPSANVAVAVPISPCRLDDGQRGAAPANVSPLSLGERELDGEMVSGSRIVSTIPAGAIGNEQPITMSAEQWYGQDLKVVVEATYRDPRTGETRYKLRDIKRQEPDARLFRVPKEYSKEDSPRSRDARDARDARDSHGPAPAGEISGGGFNRR
jgi:hypothetical protein